MSDSILCAQIARYRKAAGMTQEELGKAVGVSTQAVSRWECGGTPDVGLLPAIADRLGVTIDALFGREEGTPQNIDALFTQWLRTFPSGERMNALFRLLATNLLSIFFDRKIMVIETKGLAATCYADELPGGARVWMRSQFTSDEGLILGIFSEDFPIFLLLPEPPEGYASQFSSNGDYRKLFSTLSREGCLELLLSLYEKKFSYYTASTLSKQTGLPLEQVEGLLPSLVDCHLLLERSMELDDGPDKIYCVHDNYGLVPILYFARWFMEKNDAWNYSWDVRERPVLELTEAQKHRKKEKQHETRS